MTTEENPAYNVHTASGIDNIHDVLIFSLSDHNLTEEHVITEENPSYNILTVSGINEILISEITLKFIMIIILLQVNI